MSVLTKPYFHDEEAAFAKLESIVWPDGPVCPHCGGCDRIYKIKPNPEKRVRLGLHKCGQCRKQFTVKVGTVFEASHVPLHKWFQATYLMCASKKGISAHQIHRTLEVTYRTAWFMAHRLREAMRVLRMEKLGGDGKHVEVDETYIVHRKGRSQMVYDNRHGWKRVQPYGHKEKVLALVERGGKVRTHHLPEVNIKTLRPILMRQLDKKSRLQTDEAAFYTRIGQAFEGGHGVVTHTAGEYVRGEDATQAVENYFSILKRGLGGVYQHVSAKHLKRYLAEFDFRYNHRSALGFEDEERSVCALAGITGKRLTYKPATAA